MNEMWSPMSILHFKQIKYINAEFMTGTVMKVYLFY